MPKQSDQYSETETVRRREDALKRMLATPHKPHRPIEKKAKRRKRASAKRETA
jgi:hypothetical protein